MNAGYECLNNVCQPLCGNGFYNPENGEECDNTQTGSAVDGCNSDCRILDDWECPARTSCHLKCGNAVRDGLEQCDDGNTREGDGCYNCLIESSWSCNNGSGSEICYPNCGNGVRDTGEACDDGNADNADGCTSTCTVDAKYECAVVTNKETCTLRCGNGVLETDIGEACDDDNNADTDGCSSTCAVEANYACYPSDPFTSTSESVCALKCGNSRREADEVCDDGNVSPSDGCSADCSAVEQGWACTKGDIERKDECTFTCGDGYYTGNE